jgi:hypothetical protein
MTIANPKTEEEVKDILEKNNDVWQKRLLLLAMIMITALLSID